MLYRPLGKSGLQVSQLGFGTMSFGGDADADTSAELFHACYERGVNLFDCADVYANGESERILGKLIEGRRDELVLCTKAYYPMASGPNARGASRYHLVRALEASLRRLRTDRIDIYYIHHFDEQVDMADTLRTLDDMVRQGKILYPAVSNFAAWQVSRALGIARRAGYCEFACVQPMYSLVKRQAEAEILPMAEAEGLGVLSYSPLAGGLLTGKYVQSRSEGRLVASQMYAARYRDEAYFKAAAEFSELAQELGQHPVTLAIAWAATHEAVTAPLIGARNLEQLEPALSATTLIETMRGDASLRERVSRLWPEPPPATDRSDER